MIVAFIFALIVFLIILRGLNALPSILMLLAAAGLLLATKTGFASADDRVSSDRHLPNNDTVDQATFAETSLSDDVGNAKYKQYESDGLPFGSSFAMLPDKTLGDAIGDPYPIDTEGMYADIAQLYHYEDNPTTNDDKLSAAAMDSGSKAKKSMDIRSHWNNDNVRRHFDYEFGIHEDAHREWWQDDDLELASKHVII
jgi:hypothetical protein